MYIHYTANTTAVLMHALAIHLLIYGFIVTLLPYIGSYLCMHLITTSLVNLSIRLPS